MKKTLKLSLLLSVVLVLVFSAKVYPKANATFTKANNVISLKIKPDASIVSSKLAAFVYSFRYLRATGSHFENIVTTYSGSLDTASVVDPIDPSFRIMTFNFYDGTTSHVWTLNTEYTLFTVEAVGLGTNSFSLVADLPSYFYGPYLEIGTSDVTLYVPPFYAGSDDLVLTTSPNGLRKYATQSVILGKYWLGTGTSNWTTDANWSDGAKPTAVQDVAIIAGGVQPIADAGSVCQKLLVEAGATINVAPTGTLTVNGDLSVADDNSFVVQSGGSVITKGLVPSGNKVKVQRSIGGTNWADNNDGWHLLSSPVAAQSISGTFTPSDVTPNRYDFYSWDEPTQFWLNKKAGGMPTFLVGKGYLVSYETGVTHDFVGTLNSADKAVTLTKNGTGGSYGYNLLGNPFPSALTWATGWTLTNIGPAATYVWSNTMQDYDLISVGEAIPAENGFMVYTSVASQSLTIPEAARVHDGTAWYKAATPQIKLIAHDLNNGSSKASLVRFDPNATAGFDLAYDAYNLSGFAPKFYSAANGEKFGLNTLPEAKDGLVIPFGFEKNGSTNFSIELSESLDGVVLALRDKKTNTTVNLSKNPVYSFTSSVGDDANRFELLFGSQLGVNDSKALASASAYSVDNRIVINNVNGDTQMDIINVQGQLLKKYDFFSNGTHEISVNLSTGVYMVRLSNGGEIRTMKVFVK